MSELHLTGQMRAYYVALIAAVQAHPDRMRVLRAIETALEAEFVAAMNTPGAPDEWVDGIQDTQAALAAVLPELFPDL